MDHSQPTSNDEIERLLAEAGAGLPPANIAAGASPAPALASPPVTASDPAATGAPKPAAPRDEPIASADIELLLKQAQEAIASIDQPNLSPAAAVKSFQLDEFSGAAP
ncbi:MAG TPA: hypothetical protein VF278_11000, partial [Pirellulales bacterium]